MPLRREATICLARNPISAAEIGKSHCDTGHTLCLDIWQWRHRHDITWLRRRGSISFVDDLDLGRGAVLSWAVLSLRSIEAKPFDGEICPLWSGIFLTLTYFLYVFRLALILSRWLTHSEEIVTMYTLYIKAAVTICCDLLFSLAEFEVALLAANYKALCFFCIV